MRTRRIAVVLFLFLVLSCAALFSACGADNTAPAGRLEVTVTYWNGWDPEYVSPVEEHSFAVSRGDKLEVEADGHTLGVTVKEVGEKGIVIQTSEPMAFNTDGSIDLSTNQTTFELIAGDPVELTTPWTDMGINYTFTLRDD